MYQHKLRSSKWGGHGDRDVLQTPTEQVFDLQDKQQIKYICFSFEPTIAQGKRRVQGAALIRLKRESAGNCFLE